MSIQPDQPEEYYRAIQKFFTQLREMNPDGTMSARLDGLEAEVEYHLATIEKRSERREAVKDRPDIRELENWVRNLEGSLFILQHLGADKSTRKGVKKQISKLNKRINELKFDF